MTKVCLFTYLSKDAYVVYSLAIRNRVNSIHAWQILFLYDKSHLGVGLQDYVIHKYLTP